MSGSDFYLFFQNERPEAKLWFIKLQLKEMFYLLQRLKRPELYKFITLFKYWLLVGL